MDFVKIKKKVREAKYGHIEEVGTDVGLLCANAQEYNVEGSDIHNDAILLHSVWKNVMSRRSRLPPACQRKSWIAKGPRVAGRTSRQSWARRGRTRRPRGRRGTPPPRPPDPFTRRRPTRSWSPPPDLPHQSDLGSGTFDLGLEKEEGGSGRRKKAATKKARQALNFDDEEEGEDAAAAAEEEKPAPTADSPAPALPKEADEPAPAPQEAKE